MDSVITPSMVDLYCAPAEQFVVGELTSLPYSTNRKNKSATSEFSDVICLSDFERVQQFHFDQPPPSSLIAEEQGDLFGLAVTAADHSEELQRLCHFSSSPVDRSVLVDDMSKGGVLNVCNKTTKDDINVIVSATLSGVAVIDENRANIDVPAEKSTYKKKREHSAPVYSSYTAWNVDVDLGPVVSSGNDVLTEDRFLDVFYNALQCTLFETGCPETEVRTSRCLNRHSGNDRVTIAVLSGRAECTGLLLEGGRQCSGDMLLVMSASWLSKRTSPLKNGLCSLYVHKAISFESAGRTYLDTFDPPRRVTYLVNLFTRGASDDWRDDGEELEVDLDCPMSSSLTLSHMVDDKLFMRIMMAELGLPYPETLAFTYCSTLPYDVDRPELNFISLDTKNGVDNLMHVEIHKFLQLPCMQKHDKVVVKSCGVLWRDGTGVTFHQRNNTNAVWKAALHLLAELEEGDLILVEACCHSSSRKTKESLKYSAAKELSNRIWTTVCRGTDDMPHVTSIVGSIGAANEAICVNNSMPQSFESTMSAIGAETSSQTELRDIIQQSSESLFRRFMEFECRMSQNERGGVGAQTDIIGVNYIVSEVGDSLIPVIIDTHSYQRAVSNPIAEFIDLGTAGSTFRLFVRNMIERSQRFVMRGKTVLVVGAGGYSKKFVWPSAKDFGIEVVLVDADPQHFASQSVSQFIVYDLTDHKQDELHARNIIQLLSDRSFAVDGCVTFWEDCGPLAALICELLGLNGASYRAAQAAKKKSATQQILASKSGHVLHWPRSSSYVSKVHQVSRQADIEQAALHIAFPCVMKLEYGSSAVGVTLVHNVSECHREWSTVQDELQGENSHPGIGLGHGNNMLLMDYITGTEHDVDVIIYRRRLLGAVVTDNGPTRLPRFTETAAAMPSFLPADKQRQLIVAAYMCCIDVGLVSGVFNVEMKMTAMGPRLIEINARMAGFYVRDWIKTIYSIDVLFCAFAIACDVCPMLPERLQPEGQLVGLMVVPSAHRRVLANPSTHNVLRLLEENGVIRVSYFEPFLPPPELDFYEEPYASVAVLDCDADSSLIKVAAVFNLLGLNNEQYPVETFLKDFKKR